MNTRKFAIAGSIALLLAASQPSAQQTVIPEAVRLAADRITAAQLEKDLAYLASDELLGRNTSPRTSIRPAGPFRRASGIARMVRTFAVTSSPR